ncbi:MAG: NAD-dependent epimerase/dehydratase family protein [Opitutales bacterium]|nr:NAD-dependent epimerase/dehydratase family protein [Opitutales bacterium]
MRVLITGGSGFIGSHLAEHFQGQAEVRVLDNLRTGFRSNLEGLDVEFIAGSVCDRNLVREAVQDVDHVFHLAALVSVPESMDKPSECVDINVNGLLNVLEESVAAGVRKLCFASSAAIYGDNPTVPKLETMLPEPKSPYAITKLDGEYYCGMFQAEGRLETACLRFFNVFGSRQDPNGPYAAAVPIFFQKALSGEPITIFGDGGATRDFIFVKDIVAALIFLAENESVTGVFNAGYGRQTSVKELAESILELTGSSSEIVYAPERVGDVRHSLASVEKLKSAGFYPAGNLDAGLKAMK